MSLTSYRAAPPRVTSRNYEPDEGSAAMIAERLLPGASPEAGLLHPAFEGVFFWIVVSGAVCAGRCFCAGERPLRGGIFFVRRARGLLEHEQTGLK